MARIIESDLAKHVVEYLTSIGWDVYQEVRIGAYGRIADMVGLQGKRTWVVETKTSFNMAVIEQANYWLRYSHYVSIAVPLVSSSRSGRNFGMSICMDHGIGIMFVNMRQEIVKEYNTPKLNRFANKVARIHLVNNNQRLRGVLCAEHKKFSLAGSSGGGYWTPFRRTCKRVDNYIRSHQGCRLRAIVGNIDHHYANDNSAYSSLLHWLSEGKVDGLVVDTRRRPFKYYTSDYSGVNVIIFLLMLHRETDE